MDEREIFFDFGVRGRDFGAERPAVEISSIQNLYLQLSLEQSNKYVQELPENHCLTSRRISEYFIQLRCFLDRILPSLPLLTIWLLLVPH